MMTEMKVKVTEQPKRKVIILRGKSGNARKKMVDAIQKKNPGKYAVVRKADLRRMIDGSPKFLSKEAESFINDTRDGIIVSALFKWDDKNPKTIGVIIDERNRKLESVNHLTRLVNATKEFLVGHGVEVVVAKINKGDEVCEDCLRYMCA